MNTFVPGFHTFRRRPIHFSSSVLDFTLIGPSLAVKGVTSGGCYTLVYVQSCPSEGHSFTFSKKHGAGYLGLYPPGAVLDAQTPEGYIGSTLTVGEEEFRGLVWAYCPEVADLLLSRALGLKVGEAEQMEIDGLLAALWALSPGQDLAAGHVRSRRELEIQLKETFLRALISGLELAGMEVVSRGERRVGRFLEIRDYIQAHRDTELSLAEICAEFQVSARKVEYLFKEQLGIGPKRFLQQLRLHAARKDLIESGIWGAGAVKAAALSHGFWHLGRFACSYRSLFGENPGETVARAGGSR